MILRFKVRNFRSIKEEILIDFLASGHHDFTQFPGYVVTQKKDKVLNGICLIGNNASGKTNVLNALSALCQAVVSTTNVVETQSLDFIVPFLFDDDSKGKPTDFELVFEDGDIRYSYQLSLTKDMILHESLSFSPHGRMVLLFDRTGNEKLSFHQTYVSRENVRLIQERNLKNKPIITFAAQFNIPYLKDAYHFIADQFVFTNAQGIVNEQGIGLRLEADKAYYEFLKSVLSAADLNIDDIRFFKKRAKLMTPLPDMDVEQASFTLRDRDVYHVMMNHKIHDRDYFLNLGDESLGIQKVMAYSLVVYDALIHGRILVCDEFGSSLHPHLSAFLLSFFFDGSINHRNAQILFNTQETSLLNEQLLRRDEIYLVEKNKDSGSTELSCLKDYAVRKKENVENGYLNGRYSPSPDIDGGVMNL